MAGDMRIEPEQVKQVAKDVSSVATSLTEMQGYAEQSELDAQHFGNIRALSEAAAEYPAKALELAESVGRAAEFLNDFATRLNKSATMTEEDDLNSAWTISSTEDGA
ncbi:hypothetical protein [Amycolatopsis cihanbeyliensis]|uniref:Excreted virulence factor EspC (Type VII ESX diderm) n=1 Tax=Amycolatopsis cihanbeyliensis TaxID=1128664 RepID=A0A542DJ62_AMYCI|nr:hypothetical protein [Amycolatopsis cihanbeyliensis]TQJ03138.1 excreted virulence factor EspC (type VII ESX diderm) [Amycolatopsis cihanbeyliensis]